MRQYRIKHTWAEFHISLQGYDVYLDGVKQLKWLIFWTENEIEVGRIIEKNSSQYKIIKRQDWHDLYGESNGLSEGVVS